MFEVWKVNISGWHAGPFHSVALCAGQGAHWQAWRGGRLGVARWVSRLRVFGQPLQASTAPGRGVIEISGDNLMCLFNLLERGHALVDSTVHTEKGTGSNPGWTEKLFSVWVYGLMDGNE